MRTERRWACQPTRTYNARGLVESQTEPDGRVTTYGYDIDGQVVSIADTRRHHDLPA